VNENQIIQIVALLGWLVLAGSALAAHRLSWRKGVLMALVWGSIFLAVTLVITIVA